MLHGRTGAGSSKRRVQRPIRFTFLDHKEPCFCCSEFSPGNTEFTETDWYCRGPSDRVHRLTDTAEALSWLQSDYWRAPAQRGQGFADRARDQHNTGVYIRWFYFVELNFASCDLVKLLSLILTNFPPGVFCKRIEVTFNSKGFPICTFDTPPLTLFGPSLELHWSCYR